MHIQEINIKNRFYNYHFKNLVKAKNPETKNILIDEKNYMDLTIYFTRYVHSRSIQMLSLHYHELMGKVKKTEKKYLIVNDYMLDKVLDKIKETTDIVKFDDIKILIDTDDKLPDCITFKNVVILITCIIKDDGLLYPQIFLEEAFYNLCKFYQFFLYNFLGPKCSTPPSLPHILYY